MSIFQHQHSNFCWLHCRHSPVFSRVGHSSYQLHRFGIILRLCMQTQVTLHKVPGGHVMLSIVHHTGILRMRQRRMHKQCGCSLSRNIWIQIRNVKKEKWCEELKSCERKMSVSTVGFSFGNSYVEVFVCRFSVPAHTVWSAGPTQQFTFIQCFAESHHGNKYWKASVAFKWLSSFDFM